LNFGASIIQRKQACKAVDFIPKTLSTIGKRCLITATVYELCESFGTRSKLLDLEFILLLAKSKYIELV